MANKQINELNELTDAASGDLIPIYDLDEGGSEKTKGITVNNLARSSWIELSEVNTNTSTTSVTLCSGIPTDVIEIEVILNYVSTNGTNVPFLFGGNGSEERSGYDASISVGTGNDNRTEGIPLNVAGSHAAGDHMSAVVSFLRWNRTEHLWLIQGLIHEDSAQSPRNMACRKTFSGALNYIELGTVSETHVFDNGEARVRYR